MGLEERKIRIDQLAAGMYVCRLDRPWTGTPFPLQGFLIESDDQITALRCYGREVWIDVELGDLPDEAKRSGSTPGLVRPRQMPQSKPTDAATLENALGRIHYSDSVSVEHELPQARAAQDNAARLTSRILDDIRVGQKLSRPDVDAVVEPIVQSVLRSADAMFWVNALRRHEGYDYSHAINCCALAAAFGRHLGLPAQMLIDLGSAGLLFDIGKAQLPAGLLATPRALDAPQLAQARTHVALSLQVLQAGDLDRPDVVETIRTHHERYDGSGYPAGLQATQIPLFGRMAGIIDSFDAMTSHRPHARALARHEALQQMYHARGGLFQDELVEQFIGCLGVYPVGSLVELSGGEVGVVMAQNPARRLRPRLILLTDAKKQLRQHFAPLDLMDQSDSASSAEQVHIVQPLPPGAYGLDPAELYL